MNKLTALLVLMHVVAAASVRLTRQQHQRLAHLLNTAGQLTGNDFWTLAIENNVVQCSASYFEALSYNANQVPDDTNMIEMYNLLEQHILHYCERKFMAHSRRLIVLCPPGSPCARVTDGFQLNEYRDDNEDETLAYTLAQVMQEIDDDISSFDQFEAVFVQRGPCKAIFNNLPRLGRYRHFYTLISQPTYFERFDADHQRAANIVAACNHIPTTNGLLSTAYGYYTQL